MASQWVSDLLQGHVELRATRSGASFSNYYTINNPDFDLDGLLANYYAEGAEQDEDDPIGADVGESWQPDQAPPSNTSSPLSSAPPTPSNSRPASPEPSAAKRPRSSSQDPNEARATPPPPPPPINSAARKASKKKNSRKSRQRRAQRGEAEGNFAHPPAALLRNARHLANATFESVPLDWDEQPVASTGFTAKRGEREEERYVLEDLVGPKAKVKGMRLIDWDGRQTMGLAAPDGRIFGVLAGRPNDADWDTVHENLAEHIAKSGEHVKFPKESQEHRRGQFGAEAQGTSHGGGQTAPGTLKHSPGMTKVLLFLINLSAMVRVAHFASSVFHNWAPLLWAFYADHMRQLFDNNPDLQQNFPRSVWACITINFGPRTVCYKHRDFGNLPFGWCAITALGKFNPDRGGHLVLWECGLVIRFPPGSTILIPSAIITHSNTEIAPEETRYSVTQYTAGAIFRWVQHGCRLDEQYYSSLSAEGRRAARRDNAQRWQKGVALWSKVDDLQAAAKEVVHTLGAKR